MIKIIKKKIKLGIFFLLFIIIAPLLVLYANGDIFGTGWSLSKTGGIYINSAPINSEIYIDSKLRSSTSFFERDLLIKNLKPDLYNIMVKKEGYNSWSKKIIVLDNLVSDANVFMLPIKIDYRDIPKENFIDSKRGTTTIKIKQPNEEYKYVLSFFSEEVSLKAKKIASSSFSNKNLGTEEFPIMNGKIGLWRDKTKVFVSWYGKAESAPKYFCNKGICVKTIQVFDFKTEPTKIDFLPSYDGVIIFASIDEVFAMQVEDNELKEVQPIYKGKKPDFRLINGIIYVKDGDIINEVLL
ncbi:MAG: PEGA domain-containing protein [Candidatus Paceibacterota bacterium]|jgi:hypothetical protein